MSNYTCLEVDNIAGLLSSFDLAYTVWQDQLASFGLAYTVWQDQFLYFILTFVYILICLVFSLAAAGAIIMMVFFVNLADSVSESVWLSHRRGTFGPGEEIHQ